MGMFDNLQGILLMGIVLIFLLMITAGGLSGQDSIPNTIFKGLEFLAGDDVAKKECSDEDLARDNVDDNKELILELAREEGIPENVMENLIRVESQFKHCDANEMVLTSFDGSSVGLGQINVKTTASSSCPGLDVYDLEENARCAIIVFQQKYDICGDDEARYRQGVLNNCENEEYQRHYLLRYMGASKSWERALRCYNGLGCTPPPEGGAEICYVEKVMYPNNWEDSCPIEG